LSQHGRIDLQAGKITTLLFFMAARDSSRPAVDFSAETLRAVKIIRRVRGCSVLLPFYVTTIFINDAPRQIQSHRIPHTYICGTLGNKIGSNLQINSSAARSSAEMKMGLLLSWNKSYCEIIYMCIEAENSWYWENGS
jgi:hypothetical protein